MELNVMLFFSMNKGFNYLLLHLLLIRNKKFYVFLILNIVYIIILQILIFTLWLEDNIQIYTFQLITFLLPNLTNYEVIL